MPTDLPDENALLRRAHAGDAAALEALYADNVASARRLAVILAGPSAAEDLVADAFARVLARIRAGEGPVTNFRGYLFATIRNRHRDLMRRAGREAPVSDEPWLLESPTESVEEQVQELDEGVAVAALGSLPDRWQRVLWHLEVEGHQVPEVAAMLSMSPAAVSSLAYRAREGLKVAYLEHHLPTAAGTKPCAWVRQRLGSHVRGSLSPRAGARLEAHLTTCAACSAAAADLQHVNRKLAGMVLPVLLVGGAGAGLLDLVGAAGGSGPGGSGESGGTTASAAGAGAAGAAAARAAAAGGGAGRGATGPRPPSGPARVLRLLTGRGATMTGAGAGAGGITLVALAAAALVLVLVAVTWWVVAGADDADGPAADHPATDAATGRPDLPSSTGASPDPTATDPATDGASDGTTPAVDPLEPTGQTTGATATAAPGPRPGTAATGPGKLGATRAAPPVAVRPTAPSATAISGCGSFGSLAMPPTPGVEYVLTQGDGRQGAWEVTGKPRSGYVLAADAQQRFSGDLGAYYACPALGALSVADLGGGDWRLTAPVSATGPGSYPLTAAVTVDSDTYVPAGGVSGAGWTCWGPNPGDPQIGAGSGFMLPAGFTMDCRFAYAGAAPPDLAVTMTPVTVGPPPTGTVALTADGTPRGSATY
ncbi:RNA polymerase sigma factor [Nocardioides sp. LHD-245]|uniref:RNA polymerase sigma factor n=1 Tax=Nocardioides sp. LHD-245 TaxID=3051387 RepID=UPI0027DF95B2|nr:RNA polymerase sigma factor [Nocardioides sp. LHD-245]